MPLRDQELQIVIESDKGFEVVFVDDEDQLENLSGATAASLVVREATSSTTDMLVRRTDTLPSPDLAIDTANSKITANTLTSPERAAIKPGVYLGFAAFKLASGKWVHSEPFRVRFITSKAPTF